MKILWALRAVFYKAILANIGWMSYIGKPLYISGFKKINLGKRVRIYPHSRIEVIKNYPCATIQIEDNVSAGQNLQLISAGKLIIGEGTLISSNVMITNVNHLFDDLSVSVAQQGLSVTDTIIGKNCFIGFGTLLLPGTELGDNCIVGANSVVKGSFPKECMIAGNPAVIIKKYDQNWGWIKA